MATDPMANNNYLAMPQTGEKHPTSLSTYGADEPANESCCADSQPGPSTPSIPVPNLGGSDSMLDMSGPKQVDDGQCCRSWDETTRVHEISCPVARAQHAALSRRVMLLGGPLGGEFAEVGPGAEMHTARADGADHVYISESDPETMRYDGPLWPLESSS